jgi:hypothetical protein
MDILTLLLEGYKYFGSGEHITLVTTGDGIHYVPIMIAPTAVFCQHITQGLRNHMIYRISGQAAIPARLNTSPYMRQPLAKGKRMF